MSQAEREWASSGSRPLAGKRVMVTRARHQVRELAERIEELGGEAYAFPLIKMVPPRESGPLDEALRRIESFDWVMFTSPNGVRFFLQRMDELGIERSRLTARLAAVGPRTAAVLQESGLHVSVLPAEFVAEGLLDSLRGRLKTGETVLLPRADIARKTLPDELRRMGMVVTEVDAYDTVMDGEQAEEAADLLRRNGVYAILFTSSSTVKHFVQVMTPYDWPTLIESVRIACIGPVTAETARELGLPVHAVAEQFTVEGLLDALVSIKGGDSHGSNV
jgi:uroporphyrinogen-III synthase